MAHLWTGCVCSILFCSNKLLRLVFCLCEDTLCRTLRVLVWSGLTCWTSEGVQRCFQNQNQTKWDPEIHRAQVLIRTGKSEPASSEPSKPELSELYRGRFTRAGPPVPLRRFYRAASLVLPAAGMWAELPLAVPSHVAVCACACVRACTCVGVCVCIYRVKPASESELQIPVSVQEFQNLQAVRGSDPLI